MFIKHSNLDRLAWESHDDREVYRTRYNNTEDRGPFRHWRDPGRLSGGLYIALD